MLRRAFAIALVIASLAVAAAPIAIRQDTVSAASVRECTVYVTKTGVRYHRGSCSSLRHSRRALSRTEAIAEGYTPCRLCGGSNCE